MIFGFARVGILELVNLKTGTTFTISLVREGQVPTHTTQDQLRFITNHLQAAWIVPNRSMYQLAVWTIVKATN